MKGLFAKELAILTTSLKRNVLFVALFYGFISVASRQPYMAYALAFFFTLISYNIFVGSPTASSRVAIQLVA